MNENFMYGIGAVKHKNKKVGYVAKNSFDLNGSKPESVDVDAEQVPGAPVLSIPQSNGKIAPKFDMIQLNFESLKQFLGGSLCKKDDKIVGWTAPRDILVMDGPWEITLVTGQSILIPSAILLSNLGGKLSLTETSKIEVELKVTTPTKEKVPPYGVFDSNNLPTEWSEQGGWSLPTPSEEAAGEEKANQQEISQSE